MPVAYLILLRLEFTNGRIWEINVQEQLSDAAPDEIAEKLLGIFQEYRKDIKKIDFQMDIDKSSARFSDSKGNGRGSNQ
jgi:hypothetical protein